MTSDAGQIVKEGGLLHSPVNAVPYTEKSFFTLRHTHAIISLVFYAGGPVPALWQAA